MAKAMLGARERFLGILSRTADRVAAEDEFNRSVRALAGAAWEVARHRPPRIDHLAVFLPSNNVLYSCVLFGLIPSLYCDSIEMRPSSRVKDASRKVIELLRETCRPWISDRIRLIDLSQRAFTETCSCADAVIFTGQYENGVELMSRLSDKPLFLMFNSGPNPMIIGPQATPETTLRSLLISRLYNSGQDCLCADLVYVHRSILRGVTGQLSEMLRATANSESPPGSLVYADAVKQAEAYINEHSDQVVFGGETDVSRLLVEPTVIVHDSDMELNPPEFFSPVFCIAPYDDVADLEAWANTEWESARGMYAAVFGESQLNGPRLGTAVVLRDQTTFDHEDGNKPFGGYGVSANSVRLGDKRLHGRPLLLSAELAASAREQR
ncbi:aldehyde dehydrogenase family protein [Actinomadura yumaensis]|uniref:Aldehyde dehydrogenase family protein n=1 Tax=Actinomadura yumaensis TaxID=111807 RepID=A0ABW2CKJ1_9ACTN